MTKGNSIDWLIFHPRAHMKKLCRFWKQALMMILSKAIQNYQVFIFLYLQSWFNSSKWSYIRAKYAHALQTQLTWQFHFAVHFVRWQVLKQPYQITALSYHFYYLLNGFLCGQKQWKVIHIIADPAWMGQQQNVDNIKSAQ